MNEITSTTLETPEAVRRGRDPEASRRLGEQSKKVVADVQELGGIARDTAVQAVGSLRERGSEALHSGREHAVEAKGKVESYIVEQPLKSLAIALGAGVLLGLVVRR